MMGRKGSVRAQLGGWVSATPDADPRGRDRVGTLGGTVRGGHNSLAASNLFPGFISHRVGAGEGRGGFELQGVWI